MTIWKKNKGENTQERITITFKSNHQTPLIMIIKEYHTITDVVDYASIIWSK
jgi:hypothetical protein